MFLINKPKEITFNKFNKDKNDLENFYGLPKSIIFCKKCCFSNQKPNSEHEYKHSINTKKPTVNFNDENICSACSTTSKKRKIDWKEREKMLVEICNKYRGFARYNSLDFLSILSPIKHEEPSYNDSENSRDSA